VTETLWLLQFRRADEPDGEWQRYARAFAEEAVKVVLEDLRTAGAALEWRAVRVETTLTVEDW
jgi:hypothetical protein